MVIIWTTESRKKLALGRKKALLSEYVVTKNHMSSLLLKFHICSGRTVQIDICLYLLNSLSFSYTFVDDFAVKLDSALSLLTPFQ